VAFQLIVALRRILAEAGLFDQGIPNLTPYLDLVALGTVADMAPLTGENRILVKRGLQVLAKSPKPGLTALKEVSLITPEGDMDPWMISFRLAPRLNAPGRMGDPQDALKLLLSENPEESRRLAQELDQQNSRRQSREQEILKEAFRLLETDPSHTNRKALVLLGEGWPKGILGLIASRLVERFQKPVFVLAREGDHLEGSGRSIPGFDLAGNLSLLAPLLLRYGGHPQAAGVKLSPANLPAFSRQLEDLAAETLKTGDLTPRLLIEGELGLNTLEKEIYPHLPLLAPFGTGNPEPVFCLNGIAVREAVLVKGGHLKLTLHQNGTTVQAIGFGLGECHPQISTQVSLAFTLKTTPFRGNPYLQLKIKDLPLKS
jgi:single-stranded-DNA-specific exonuclease